MGHWLLGHIVIIDDVQVKKCRLMGRHLFAGSEKSKAVSTAPEDKENVHLLFF